MPGYSRFRRTRWGALVGVAALSAPLALPATAMERAPSSLIDAEVVSVVPIRTPGRGMPGRAHVTVQLDEGTQHRVTYNRPLPKVGERVRLQMARDELRPVRPLLR